MEVEELNKGQAIRIYLLVNLLYLALYTILVVRAFQFHNLRQIAQNESFVVIFGTVFLGWFLGTRAKKKGGGMLNPITNHKRALQLYRLAAVAMLIGMLGSFNSIEVVYVAATSVPLLLIAIILAFRGVKNPDDSEILDDFELDA
jgi:hypothetical protein